MNDWFSIGAVIGSVAGLNALGVFVVRQLVVNSIADAKKDMRIMISDVETRLQDGLKTEIKHISGHCVTVHTQVSKRMEELHRSH